MIPAQAFIYLLITFGVIFYFHQFTEWKKAGRPSSAILSASSFRRFKLYSVVLWICIIAIAVLWWEGLEGSALHLASYLIAAVLGNVGILLKAILREVELT